MLHATKFVCTCENKSKLFSHYWFMIIACVNSRDTFWNGSDYVLCFFHWCGNKKRYDDVASLYGFINEIFWVGWAIVPTILEKLRKRPDSCRASDIFSSAICFHRNKLKDLLLPGWRSGRYHLWYVGSFIVTHKNAMHELKHKRFTRQKWIWVNQRCRV